MGFHLIHLNIFGHSVEKDGSSLSDEKQTIQTSLFALLKDFLKSPTQEELHTVLAYVLTVGEEQQVITRMFYNCFYFRSLKLLSFDLFRVIFYSKSLFLYMLFWHICTFRNALRATSNFTLPTPHFLALYQPPPSHLSRVSLTGGEGLGCAVWALEEQPSSRAGADSAAGVGRGAAVQFAAQSKLWGWGQREGLQGEIQSPDLCLTYCNLLHSRYVHRTVNCENGILTVSLWLPSRFCTRSSRASVCRSATSIGLNWRILAIVDLYAVLITFP